MTKSDVFEVQKRSLQKLLQQPCFLSSSILLIFLFVAPVASLGVPQTQGFRGIVSEKSRACLMGMVMGSKKAGPDPSELRRTKQVTACYIICFLDLGWSNLKNGRAKDIGFMVSIPSPRDR